MFLKNLYNYCTPLYSYNTIIDMARTEINNINSIDVDYAKASKGIKQYLDVKKEHPNTLLLFRMGDFYETFFEDAYKLSKELEITLTGRMAGELGKIPLAGIPAKALDIYMKKLVDKGINVAICEQLEDPKTVKATEVVKRGIVRIVTPGTIIENDYLDKTSNNYICSLFEEKGQYGFAYADISTGEFKVTQAPLNIILSELARIKPVEIIGPAIAQKALPFQIVPDEKIDLPDDITSIYKCSKVPAKVYAEVFATNNLKNALNINNLDSLGYKDCKLGYRSAAALLAYIWENMKGTFPKIERIEHYELSQYVLMDASTRRNLELTETLRDKNKYGSLYWAIDRTNTNMGARLLKSWICQPLKNKEEIESRQNNVEIIINSNTYRFEIIDLLNQIYDIQRLTTRLSSSVALPKDFISLKNSLFLLPKIDEALTNCGLDIFKTISPHIPELIEFASIIDKTLLEDGENNIKEGNIIKKNVDETLDYLRDLKDNIENWIEKFAEEEREKTGIKSLKVGYNKVFGYFIEVTNSYANLVPQHYIRRQTMTGAERYITEELKKQESEVLSSKTKSCELEYKIFTDLRKYAQEYVSLIRKVADKIAELDVLTSFATIALEANYVKPELTNSSEFIVKNGRHPVLERILPLGTYVSNDLELSDDVQNPNSTRFMILTGPNMAGKSTYMRQNALIAILAQIGSFVPADYAKIGLADKIFTRVGASDDLTLGQSTFMVEMVETAYILNNATEKSLILIDEIGRGTSTYDGVAIAWSVAEHIAMKINARCIFATHYHELNVMTKTYPQIKNYRITISESDGKIEFLRKIVPGEASKSYGTHVAQMAGLPISVVKRSQELIVKLQKDFSKDLSTRRKSLEESADNQLSLFK